MNNVLKDGIPAREWTPQANAKPCYQVFGKCIANLTRLGWVASVPLHPGPIQVLHGDLVETDDKWIVEGCWDSDPEAGDFDRSACFFGSGLRIRDLNVYLVASRATVDSIYYCATGNEIIASNSLLLLLSQIGGALDNNYSYYEEFSGALRGIQNYKPTIPIIHPSIREIRQLYFGNLRIGSGAFVVDYPPNSETFSSFDGYFAFLSNKTSAINANATSKARKHPMNCYTTISAGYDSPAVSVLARRFGGVNHCITNDPEAAGAVSSEDARQLAEVLQLDTALINTAPAGLGDRELFYYAAGFQHFEMAYDAATRLFEASDTPTLLFTGYHGDKVWAKHLDARHLNDELKRGDMSGKGLGEIRLKAGFVNAPIPFLGARKISQIFAISNSPEMAPWSIGGDYDRPIPRRICEEAGLPRWAFGQRKFKITSHKVQLSDPHLRALFLQDLKRDFRIGQARILLYEFLSVLTHRLGAIRSFDFLTRWKRSLIHGKPNLRMCLFIWAVNKTVTSMRSGLRD